MADFVFNVAKGRVAQLVKNVDDGVGGSVLRVIIINNNSATDATMKDYATVSALLGDANVAEATNSGYARKSLAAANVSFTVNTGSDTVTCDIDDQTWTAVAATGGAWTDLVIAYDASGSDADTVMIPLTLHDFAVTPDGSDITAQIFSGGFYSAS